MEPYPIRFLKNLNRGREVITVFVNYGFGDVLQRLGLLSYLKWGRRMLSSKQQEEVETLTTARRIRLALQDLGPTFVKFGQVLSTRPDLIPADLICELANLQERVPPFSLEEVHKQIQGEFGKPATELFAEFQEEPLAAGSLGQVHIARDHQGRKLAVKIRRPRVIQEVERDLSLMMEIAQLAERHVPELKLFDPVGLVNHFTRTIRRELNYEREARTIRDFSRMFAEDTTLHVPFVDESLSTDAVLTMEFISGVRIDDVEKLRSMGIAPETIARKGAQIFIRQAFDFGLFHGDPHPGNIRVEPNGRIALLDYGMVGFLTESKRDEFIDLFLAITRHDAETAVRIIQNLGHASQSVETSLLQADVRDFIDSYYGVELGKLKVGRLLNDFISILSNHGLQCPGDMMLLIRAIVTLEGVGRQLDPTFNLSEVLAPVIERLIKQRYDPKKIAERAVADVKHLLKTAHDLPLHLGRTLKKASEDDLKVQFEHKGLDRLINEFDRSSNRVVVGLVVSSLVVSTALIVRVSTNESRWVAIPLFLASGLLSLWLVWGILRSGRL